ncbi:LETM1-related biofilm-associated protein [Winogradskyella jejuensis]|uniref:LETM1-like protein n=1 Tax=Winogradskyella jejuensis TaxID=1089305 RepID=A0A1M5SR76_9FLAO|nr:LETM1-related biofilm-associated protein [Winogradskyella jejuensis]SHH40473.1 LETM1-like protein [Winogradskyella jejuensis]
MNPSATGWIKKLLTFLPESNVLQLDKASFYKRLKATGFIYGSNINCICDLVDDTDFNEEERCKVNLVTAFYYIFNLETVEGNFLNSVVDYYKATDEHKRSFLSELFGEPSSDKLLEQIIHKRIHIDDNIITKNFNYFLINAFLFIDIIGYHRFLTERENTKTYISNFESALETIVFTVLDSKTNKTEYDQNLIKLFEASLRHKKETQLSKDQVAASISGTLEKRYVVDIVCMASWSDKQIDKNEYLYLNQLRQDLDIDSHILIQSIDDINAFYEKNRDKIAFLSAKNLAQSFYDNSSSIVTRLIKRNSKRLTKELSQSKEAIYLLTQSTKRNLTEEEQKKIQNQLLDIFKSIPSLAIFMLPGGMLLLPLFVKFIPKLLPSAFDENRIDED